MIEGEGLDWATAEALAMGSLLHQGQAQFVVSHYPSISDFLVVVSFCCCFLLKTVSVDVVTDSSMKVFG